MIRLLIVLSLFGCSGSSSSVPDAAVHLDGLSCAPSGTCAGAQCGNTCCADGEACIDGTCMCGTNPSCTGGNMCASPVVKPDRCGGICCGVTSVCPG
ncbi:MAG TPA: hypothetical protein VGO00_09015 [Kofleriaceae bacterium]|nr:hypothetical protein [Kofleriaceae bacterium]